MKYRSTRGGVQGVSFTDAVMMGLAPDRGLLVPEEIPRVNGETLSRWKSMAFDELSFEIISLYVDPTESRTFGYTGSEEVTPLVDLSRRGGETVPGVYLLELFHGPTFAFKDVALQFLGRLFELILKRKRIEGEPEDDLAILGATSGDTGSSAIYGVRGREAVECFILYPKGRTSKIQEAQMATVSDANVHAIALEGAEFDDCQKIVKSLFADAGFRKRNALGAVNSINWARIVAQIVYYFYAAFRLAELTSRDTPPVFSVPTGNFGDVLAGWYAAAMGCPCSCLIVATNSNDILHRFFETGVYERPEQGAQPTLAPSMDICVSSNFERFVFHCSGNDPSTCGRLMADFEKTGSFVAPKLVHDNATAQMLSASVDKNGILSTIRDWYAMTSYVLDPHTACGVYAALELRSRLPNPEAPLVCLACAHHAKFPAAVIEAIGPAKFEQIQSEPTLAKLLELPFRNIVLPNSRHAVAQFIDDTMVQRRKS